MAEKLTNKELRALLTERKATARGDAAEVLVETITKLDKIFGDVYENTDIPTDVRDLRNILISRIGMFNSIADRQVELPNDPNAIDPLTQSPT